MRYASAIALLAMLLLVAVARGQERGRAGVVVQFGDGRVESACVEFDGPEISGIDLLIRSGLAVNYDAPGGGSICAIGGEGCQFPTEGCFCQCASIGGCRYWSYHYLIPGQGWQYAQFGATTRQLRDGDVDGWRWVTGGPNDADPPPPVTFADLCAPAPPPPPPTATAAPPTETPFPEPTATPVPPTEAVAAVAATTGVPPSPTRVPPTASPTLEPTGEPTTPSIPAATMTPRPTASPPAETGGDSSSELALFGLVVFALAGGLLLTRRVRG